MVRNAYQGIGTEYETLLRAFDKKNAALDKHSFQNIVSTKTQQGMF